MDIIMVIEQAMVMLARATEINKITPLHLILDIGQITSFKEEKRCIFTFEKILHTLMELDVEDISLEQVILDLEVIIMVIWEIILIRIWEVMVTIILVMEAELMEEAMVIMEACTKIKFNFQKELEVNL
jgi:hypothetical protein